MRGAARIAVALCLLASVASAEEMRPIEGPGTLTTGTGDYAKWLGPLSYTITGPTFTITQETVKQMKEGTLLRVRDGRLEIVENCEDK